MYLFFIYCYNLFLSEPTHVRWFHMLNGLTQLHQVRGNGGTHSGKRCTGRHGGVPDGRGRQLAAVNVHQTGAGQNTEFTHQHKEQGQSGITCSREERDSKGGRGLLAIWSGHICRFDAEPPPHTHTPCCYSLLDWMRNSASAPSRVKLENDKRRGRHRASSQLVTYAGISMAEIRK